MTELTIDREFHDLIPPIEPGDLKELERGILKDGCLDSLKVWNGTIVDGHNRYEICCRHGVEFLVTDMEFADREEAKIWILRNQLGRRNLLDYQRGVVAIKLEALLRPKAEHQQQSGLKTSRKRGGQGAGKVLSTLTEPINVRKEVAKEAKLSEGTIRKVKIIHDQATDEQKQRLAGRTASINQIYHEILPQEPSENQLRLKAINTAFEGVTLDMMQERQAAGQCPCCGQAVEKPKEEKE